VTLLEVMTSYVTLLIKNDAGVLVGLKAKAYVLIRPLWAHDEYNFEQTFVAKNKLIEIIAEMISKSNSYSQ